MACDKPAAEAAVALAPDRAPVGPADRRGARRTLTRWDLTVGGSCRAVSCKLTNLDKVLFPGATGEPPVTKRDLIRYYARSPR